jgi:hypothetical protein
MSDASFEESLIGTEHTNTVNAYYHRDTEQGLLNMNTIIKNLRKLGYYNINRGFEEECFLRSKLIIWIKNNSYTQYINMSFYDVITIIKNTDEYNAFINRLNHRIERAMNLSVFINTNDLYDFYSSLTMEELNTLGY